MACHQVKGQQRNGDKVYAEVGRKRNGKAGSNTQKDEKKANVLERRELIS